MVTIGFMDLMETIVYMVNLAMIGYTVAMATTRYGVVWASIELMEIQETTPFIWRIILLRLFKKIKISYMEALALTLFIFGIRMMIFILSLLAPMMRLLFLV